MPVTKRVSSFFRLFKRQDWGLPAGGKTDSIDSKIKSSDDGVSNGKLSCKRLEIQPLVNIPVWFCSYFREASYTSNSTMAYEKLRKKTI